MTPIPLRPGAWALAALCLAATPARAQSLLDLFAAACSFDAGYRSAPLQLAEQERTIPVGQACFGVLSRQGQARALEAAEASSQSALEANKVGYQVGMRINIGVLSAQSPLFQTQRDLARARYDVLPGGLKLRQANGTLTPQDLQAVNGLLLP